MRALPLELDVYRFWFEEHLIFWPIKFHPYEPFVLNAVVGGGVKPF